MLQLQQAIIRPKTEQSPGTFSDSALCGIPYSLQWDPIECTIIAKNRTLFCFWPDDDSETCCQEFKIS